LSTLTVTTTSSVTSRPAVFLPPSNVVTSASTSSTESSSTTEFHDVSSIHRSRFDGWMDSVELKMRDFVLILVCVLVGFASVIAGVVLCFFWLKRDVRNVQARSRARTTRLAQRVSLACRQFFNGPAPSVAPIVSAPLPSGTFTPAWSSPASASGGAQSLVQPDPTYSSPRSSRSVTPPSTHVVPPKTRSPALILPLVAVPSPKHPQPPVKTCGPLVPPPRPAKPVRQSFATKTQPAGALLAVPEELPLPPPQFLQPDSGM
jgi:hypothetical protein